MDIAEAETGAMRLRIEQVDLVATVRNAVDLYADVADEKQIPIEVTAPPLFHISADRARLTQALANLLDNAVKYTPAGGRVTVSISTGTGPTAVVEVSDTGVGIPADELPQIWDRLFRGDRSRSERGLGLGLSLVKAIVEAHGGTVEVRSTPGAGSTFIIELPVDVHNYPRRSAEHDTDVIRR
jgi:signal transduction histidine kinase